VFVGLRSAVRKFRRGVELAGKPKIFCVGCNKTGTTSLEKVFRDLGYQVGEQLKAERMLEDWAKRDFSNIITYCRSAQVFQDVPFSLLDTFKVMDQAFPKSRFILTVRDSAEQWYSSLIRFHGKMWANGRVPPTSDDLKNAMYIYKGRPWEANRMLFNTPEDNPYEKNTLLAFYEKHNADVLEYFKGRPDDLLVLNVSKPGEYQRFCQFLGIVSDRMEFPWENKTEQVNKK
jgi:hypothetical protein